MEIENKKVHNKRGHWMWISIFGYMVYMQVFDDVFVRPYSKSERAVIFFPFLLAFFFLGKLLFWLCGLVKINNDLIKNALVFLTVASSVFFVVWTRGKDAILSNFNLILVYHVSSLLLLLIVYIFRNHKKQTK